MSHQRRLGCSFVCGPWLLGGSPSSTIPLQLFISVITAYSSLQVKRKLRLSFSIIILKKKYLPCSSPQSQFRWSKISWRVGKLVRTLAICSSNPTCCVDTRYGWLLLLFFCIRSLYIGNPRYPRPPPPSMVLSPAISSSLFICY